MKRVGLFLLVCCMLCVCFLPALAQEEGLTVINITYTDDAALSSGESVEAQVTMVCAGQETAFHALLSLNDESTDVVEIALPQRSLRIDSEEMRFILFNDGNDALYSKVVGAVCGDLIVRGPVAVPVSTLEPVEVYLNGEYWGLYTKREVVEDAIARFEGLADTSMLNVAANAGKKTVYGNGAELKETFQSILALDFSQEENRQTLEELFDTESFLNCMAVNAYFGNANVFGDFYYYQVENGPWKCAAGYFTYAFSYANDNTIGRLVIHEGEERTSTDTVIIADKLLKEPVYRDAFLAKIGALYQAWPATVMQSVADAENERIAAALPAHINRWAGEFVQAVQEVTRYPVADAQEAILLQQYDMNRLRNKTMVRRPWYVYDSAQSELHVSDEDMERYFGTSKPNLPEVSSDTWEEYKAANP